MMCAVISCTAAEPHPIVILYLFDIIGSMLHIYSIPASRYFTNVSNKCVRGNFQTHISSWRWLTDVIAGLVQVSIHLVPYTSPSHDGLGWPEIFDIQ